MEEPNRLVHVDEPVWPRAQVRSAHRHGHPPAGAESRGPYEPQVGKARCDVATPPIPDGTPQVRVPDLDLRCENSRATLRNQIVLELKVGVAVRPHAPPEPHEPAGRIRDIVPLPGDVILESHEESHPRPPRPLLRRKRTEGLHVLLDPPEVPKEVDVDRVFRRTLGRFEDADELRPPEGAPALLGDGVVRRLVADLEVDQRERAVRVPLPELLAVAIQLAGVLPRV